ncbi:MAG: hypothetical protein GXX86_13900 [Propionibacterium sp.]|nr:hypothetical protein [Propionibacterium sp.]
MVHPNLLARIDELDADELDELIEYASTRRLGVIDLTDHQRAVLHARRSSVDPRDWLTDDEFDTRLNTLIS